MLELNREEVDALAHAVAVSCEWEPSHENDGCSNQCGKACSSSCVSECSKGCGHNCTGKTVS